MKPKVVVPVALAAALGAAIFLWLRHDAGTPYYTGFVEGEERVIRSEVGGRVLEVSYGEGDEVPADAPIAKLDDRDIRARLEARRRERDVVASETRTQEERVGLVRETWERGRAARRADVRAANAAAGLAAKNAQRERRLVESGASTPQALDEAEARLTQAKSRLEQARELLAQTEAQGREVDVATAALETLGERQKLIDAQIAELEVTLSKHVVAAPATPTRVQTQYLWPGELAQPGSAIVSVLDPRDKYVQIYVPVADAAGLRVGARVEIELDGRAGVRTPGEISFIADQASFTPEKIETRSDRLGQVYRAKVRILEDVEAFRPGTEGNVYLVGEERPETGSRLARDGAAG